MGLPMANRPATSFDVSGWDLSATQRQQFPSAPESATDGLTDANVVVTMLPEGNHVTDVYQTQVFTNVASGTLLIDCSTIDVETTRSLSNDAQQRGLHMVDAPVSGGPEGAAAGSLSFLQYQ